MLSDDRAAGWRAFRGDVPGEDPEPLLLFYCPICAAREFGSPFELRDRVSWDESNQ
jgi:hypothetical protein